MNRTPVASSRVKSLGHADETLEVEFTSGAVYQYTPVPQTLFAEILKSDSIGKDIQRIIDNKDIICTKIHPSAHRAPKLK